MQSVWARQQETATIDMTEQALEPCRATTLEQNLDRMLLYTWQGVGVALAAEHDFLIRLVDSQRPAKSELFVLLLLLKVVSYSWAYSASSVPRD